MPFSDQISVKQDIIPADLVTRFRRELVVLALDGAQPRAERQAALGAAFMWAESPQGAAFWQYEQDAIRFGGQPDWVDGDCSLLTNLEAPRRTDLSDEARSQLAAWLVQSVAI